MSNQNSQSRVAVLETSTLAVTGFVPGISPFGVCGAHGCLGTGAGEGLAGTPDGGVLYAAGSPGGIIDTQALTIGKQFQFGGPVVVH
jgi:hypothetical protein